MALTLCKGRPADTSGRLQKEIDCYDLLDRLGVEYERIDHEALFTIDACAEVDRALGFEFGVCKNLLLCNKQRTDFYMYLLAGTKRFETKVFSRFLGVSRLSFAPGEMMEELVNITPGSLSVLGLMYDEARRVRLCVDEAVLQSEFFACHPCVNTSTLKFRTADLVGKVIPALGHEPIVVYE